MVVLKKIKASSLNEVIVATVIIMVVFSISISILSNIMQNSLYRNTQPIENKLNELVYRYQKGQLELPYQLQEKEWLITVKNVIEGELNTMSFEATSKQTKKLISRKIIAYEKE